MWRRSIPYLGAVISTGILLDPLKESRRPSPLWRLCARRQDSCGWLPPVAVFLFPRHVISVWMPEQFGSMLSGLHSSTWGVLWKAVFQYLGRAGEVYGQAWGYICERYWHALVKPPQAPLPGRSPSRPAEGVFSTLPGVRFRGLFVSLWILVKQHIKGRLMEKLCFQLPRKHFSLFSMKTKRSVS